MEQIFLTSLSLLLIFAAISDIRGYVIPNWISVAILLLFVAHLPVYWPPVIALMTDTATAAFIFVIGLFLFARGLFGGGDVKLLSALTLWVGLIGLPRLLVVMTLTGGILALALLLVRRMSRDPQRKLDRRIPYGVAIAAAGIDFCLHRAGLAW